MAMRGRTIMPLPGVCLGLPDPVPQGLRMHVQLLALGDSGEPGALTRRGGRSADQRRSPRARAAATAVRRLLAPSLR
jgi:hypothetical protein